MEVISGRVKKSKSASVCTSRECAADSLKYLGRRMVSAGHWKHEVIRHVTGTMPEGVVERIAGTEARRVWGEYGGKKE
jgi:hypothetical protein